MARARGPFLLSSILCATLLGLACSPGPDSPGAKADGAPGGATEIAFITTAASDLWTIVRKGAEAAAAERPHIEVDFRINDESTSANQRRIIDDMLSKGVGGIVIGPIDPVNQRPYLDQVAEQVPVVVCDSDVPGSKRSYYVGSDNVAAGHQAGELIKEVLPRGGTVMLFVGKRDAQNAVDRIQGLEKAIEGAGIEILDVRTDDVDYVRAKANASDTLIQHPGVGALVGLWSYNCPTILSAVGDAGRLGEIPIVCFDEDDETLVGVRDGHVHATVIQQPYEFGYQSVRILADIIAGNTEALPTSEQVIIPTLIIRQADVAPLMRRVDELLDRR
jgi:ribose transport system substrate-binding protein